MIVAGEMKHSVQGQNLDFLRRGMTQPPGILLGDVRRNRDIAGQSVYQGRLSRLGGNESTSVGWSFPRKRRFSERSSRLLVTSTLTAPASLTARLARATNFARAVSLNPATGLRRITKFFASFAVLCALRQSCFPLRPKQTGGPHPGALLFNLTRSTRWFLLPRRARPSFAGAPFRSHCLCRSSLDSRQRQLFRHSALCSS